jgi:hypothetical protein
VFQKHRVIESGVFVIFVHKQHDVSLDSVLSKESTIVSGKIQDVTDNREVKVLGFRFIHRENEFFYGRSVDAVDY